MIIDLPGVGFAIRFLPLWLGLLPANAGAGDFSGLALVDEDASLKIGQQTVQLWGIHIPATHTDCLRHQRPPRCGQRAALSLDNLIAGFVRCTPKGAAPNGRVLARCRANYSHFDDGVDLAAWLLSQGWAVALADAPIEYQTQERIARHAGLGIWGLPTVVQP